MTQLETNTPAPYPLHSNIILPKPNPTPSVTKEIRIHPALQPFIYELAVKFPKWRFTALEYGYKTDTIWYAKTFEVYNEADIAEGGKRSGVIELRRRVASEHVWVFALHNLRIANDRSRGNCIVTKSTKTALNAVTKYFSPPVLEERLDTTDKLAANIIQVERNNAYDKQRMLIRVLLPAMEDFVLSKFSEFSATLSTPTQESASTSLGEVVHNKRVVDEMFDMFENSKHLTLIIDKSTYVVKYGGTMKILQPEELSDSIRSKLGKLKMLPEQSCVVDVGVRVGASAFVIFPDDDFTF